MSIIFLNIISIKDNNGPWYVSTNVDKRIADGIIAVSLANSNQNPSYKTKIC